MIFADDVENTGINPESGRDRVYIGEAEVIRNRIKGHLDREFWKTLVFFVSKDENLTKAHIKYLEGKLIETARAGGRFELENTQASGSHLPEPDSVFVITAYDLVGKPLKAYRRRGRRRQR